MSERSAVKVPARSIIAALVMLTGILVLAFGYFGEHSTVISAGVIITLAGVFLELVFTTVGTRYLARPKQH